MVDLEFVNMEGQEDNVFFINKQQKSNNHSDQSSDDQLDIKTFMQMYKKTVGNAVNQTNLDLLLKIICDH